MAGADEGGTEGVPQDVAGERRVEPGVGGECGEDVVGAAGGEAPAAGVEEQGRCLARGGPGGAGLQLAGERVAELGVDADLAIPLALAGADDQPALAGGEADVVDVEGDSLAEAPARIARDEGPRPVVRARAVLHGP